jgi:hypothetical protein
MPGFMACGGIRSYLATAAKRGTGMLDALNRAASATPGRPKRSDHATSNPSVRG